eukprot:13282821-Alexandrium_andersonii.AAC.1
MRPTNGGKHGQGSKQRSDTVGHGGEEFKTLGSGWRWLETARSNLKRKGRLEAAGNGGDLSFTKCCPQFPAAGWQYSGVYICGPPKDNH